jgi:hypothetical protein
MRREDIMQGMRTYISARKAWFFALAAIAIEGAAGQVPGAGDSFCFSESPGGRVAPSFRAGLAASCSTGREEAILPYLGLGIVGSRFRSDIGIGAAIPGDLIDSMNAAVSARVWRGGAFQAGICSLADWHSFGDFGWQLRIGEIVDARLGAGEGQAGLYLGSSLGCSLLVTRMPSISGSLTDIDPIGGLFLGYRPARGIALGLSLANWNYLEASTWSAIFAGFGVSCRISGFFIEAEAAAKMIDLYALSAGVDGGLVRLGLRIPAHGAERRGGGP